MTDTVFRREFGERFFDTFWQFNPEAAINNGYYKAADRLIVPDAASRKRELAQLEKWLAQLRRIDPQSLSPNVRADWVLLENEFVSSVWAIDEYRSWQWNPAVYNVAEPFAILLSTEYAPLEERLRTVTGRRQDVPAFYEAARANIKTPTLEHTRLAIEQNRGALSVFAQAVHQQVADSKLSASERERSRAGCRPPAPRSKATSVGSRGWRSSSRTAAHRRVRSASGARSTRSASSTTSSPAILPRRCTRTRARRKSACSTRMSLLSDCCGRSISRTCRHRTTVSTRSGV